MKVKYKAGSIHSGVFEYTAGDRITIVESYWTSGEEEEDRVYFGTLARIGAEGIWAVLEGEPEQEKYFSFSEIEAVLDGDRIPFLGGTSKRRVE